MIVYKAVTRTLAPGLYHSIWVEEPLRIVYALNKEVKLPKELVRLKCGIMVFNTLDNAKRWLGRVTGRPCSMYAILECKAYARYRTGLPRAGCSYPHDLEEYIEVQTRTPMPVELWPEGTLGFTRIIPLKEVRL